MVAMAGDSGTLLDDNGKPLAGQTLTIDVRDSGWEPVATVKTDAAGHFEFAAVPAEVKVYFWIESGSGRPEYIVRDNDRVFAPGEVRKNEELKARRVDRAEPCRGRARTCSVCSSGGSYREDLPGRPTRAECAPWSCCREMTRRE